MQGRAGRRLATPGIRGHPLEIDGFNLLMTVEAALSGGIIIVGRDGCHRDMASVHGTFRQVQETLPALQLITTSLNELGPSSVRWLLDSPVSNSGKLADQIRKLPDAGELVQQVELVTDPDAILRQSAAIVVTADSVILDQCQRWSDLGSRIIAEKIPAAKCVPMAVQ